MGTWKMCTIADIGTVVGGATPSTKKEENYDGGTIAWITPKDLAGFSGRFISCGERNITEMGLKSCSAQMMPKHTILFSSRAPIGYIAIAAKEVCTNQGFKSVIPNENTDYMFLYYLLKYNKENIESLGSGTTFKEVSASTMRGIQVKVPESLDEQKAIASVLSALDDKIESNVTINDNLYQQLDAIYHITYPYLPSDELPAGWKCVPLGTLCDSISIKHSFDKEKLIFLNTGDVENGNFLHSIYSPVKDMPGQAKKSIKANDILYSEIRPINRHFAFVNFQADDYVVSTKLMVIRSRKMDSRRLYHFLTTQDIINELQIEAESRSGTFPQIRFENVQRLPIIIAPLDIELQFTQILNDYYNIIDNNIRENQHLIALRDAILPKLMSGEIDVTDIEI
ncbi:MAG: restriction endonuclease subunit S [Lachnospiraceae bacterium]|nr:restriction endonuclease subunit S [Lachnospiraceae bacterium]